MKMDEARRPPFRPLSKRPPKLKIVKRRFIVLGFNNVYTFILNQLLGKLAGLPRETLWRKTRIEETLFFFASKSGMRLAGEHGGPVIVRDPVNDQSSLALFFNPGVGSFPQLADHMNGLSRLGKESRDVKCVSADPARRRRRVFAADYQVSHRNRAVIY
jgi:hypothetical protein